MIVHKLLVGDGAGTWLPFGLSRLRALAKMHGASRFFSEKYWGEGFSVEVKQAPPFQYVTIRALPTTTPVAPWGIGWSPTAFITLSGVSTFAQSNRLFQFLPPAGGPLYPFAEVLGAVTRNSGKAYFEIECPVGSVQTSVGLAISAMTPGVSIYDDPNYWSVLFYDNSTGAAERSGTSGSFLGFATSYSGLFQPLFDVIGFEVDCDAGQIDNVYVNGVLQTITDANFTNARAWTAGTTIRPYAQVRDRPFVFSTPTDDMELCSVRLHTATNDFRYGPSAGYEPWDTVGGGAATVAAPTVLESADPYNVWPVFGTPYTIAAGQVAWFLTRYGDGLAPGDAIYTFTFDCSTSDVGAELAIYNANGVCMKSGGNSLSFEMMNEVDLYIAVTFSPTFGHDFAATSAGGGGTVILTMS